MMIKKICTKIETNRNSDNLIWKIIVFIKDILWFLSIFFIKIILPLLIIVLAIIEIYKQNKEYKKLKKEINLKIPNNKKEIRLFVIVKNEANRIPFFLKYYREAGVNRFFFLNNKSTDNTVEILKKEKDVHIVNVTGKLSEKQALWRKTILDKYGEDYWCVNTDIDEFLIFPYMEKLDFKKIIKKSEKQNIEGFGGYLIDMYSKKSIKNTEIPQDYKIFNEMGFFDDPKKLKKYKYQDTCDRVFKCNRDIKKIPLVKWNKNIYLRMGHHKVTKINLSDKSFAVLHFKYASDFIKDVENQIKKINSYSMNIYQEYFYQTLIKNSNLSLFNPKYSVKYKNPYQLKRLGFGKIEKEKFIDKKFNMFKEYVMNKYDLRYIKNFQLNINLIFHK